MSRTVHDELQRAGHASILQVFDAEEVHGLLQCVESAELSGDAVMASDEVYAVRRAFQMIPGLRERVWKPAMKALVCELVGETAFVTKSIWFNKPAGGNWYVPYHQDISISVEHRAEVPGYTRWTNKHGVVGVVPPGEVLEHTLTLRIHLDDADNTNGALKVKPGSHRHGIVRDASMFTEEVECPMRAGDVMLMRPLLLHASMRSTTDRPRRVLHIEMNRLQLAEPLRWAERLELV